MSPRAEVARAVYQSFPRVSGDEPAVTVRMSLTVAFSPRERG